MLKHEISPYEYKAPLAPTFLRANDWEDGDYVAIKQPGGGYVNYKITPYTSKEHYSLWISEQPFKRGDYVCRRYAPWPAVQDDLFRVCQLQEVRHFITFDEAGFPLALEVATAMGDRFWTRVKDWVVFNNIAQKAELAFDVPPL